jgi:hypothetical protein
VSALPEHVSAVEVTDAVDGTRDRRRASGNRRQLASRVDGYTVDPRVMAAAKAALRPGQRIELVGPDEVRIVHA